MLMCVLLGTGLPGFGQDGTDSDGDSLHIMHYTEFDTSLLGNTNVSLAKVQAIHVLKFATQSLVFVKTDAPEHLFENNQAKLTALTTNVEVQPSAISLPDGYTMMTLSPNEVFALQSRKSDGTWGKITSIDTRQSDEFGIIEVSENLGNALAYWKESEDLDLYDFLMAREELSKYEVYEFLQSFVKDGAPLLDIYMQGIIPPNAFIRGDGPNDPPPPPPGPECTCRVLKIALGSTLTPSGSSATDLAIYPRVYPTHIIRETNRVKFWETGSFMGPARYQQIWGETKKCRNADERRTWGSQPNNLNNPLNHNPQTALAVISIQQLCKQGNWKPGDCYCTQELTYQYEYHAQLDATANVKGAFCFNMEQRYGTAFAMDVAAFNLVSEVNNTYEVLHSDASFGAAAAYCQRDFDEQKLYDAIELGFKIYAYTQGAPELSIADTLVSQLVKLLWKDYQKTSAFEKLESLITEPWVEQSCTTATNGHELRTTTRTIQLKNREVLHFILNARSELEVAGRTDWHADARVLSGFGMSVVIGKNENVGQANDYCCTKAAGMYQTASLHPLYQSNDYKNSIGKHFYPQLSCCHPGNPGIGQIMLGGNDRDLLVGDDLLQCKTTVNEQLKHNPASQLPALNAKVSKANNTLIVEGIPNNERYTAELFSIDGRLLFREQAIGDGTFPLEGLSSPIIPGIYLFRVTSKANYLTQKIFLP